MKTRIHRGLSELIREGCEGCLNVQINPRWFSWGNVFPDCSHQRLLHLHELDSAGRMVERMIRDITQKGRRVCLRKSDSYHSYLCSLFFSAR